VTSLLTAFYMTRQVLLVFYGPFRSAALVHGNPSDDHGHAGSEPHESPATMTIPLIILAIFAIGAGLLNLPGIHWLSAFLGQPEHSFNPIAAGLGTLAALIGIGLGVAYYRRAFITSSERDPLDVQVPGIFAWLNGRLFVDQLYAASIGRFTLALESLSGGVDRVIDQVVTGFDRLTGFLGKVNYIVDDTLLNDGADQIVRGASAGGDGASRLETGKAQDYMAIVFAGMLVLGIVSLYLLGQ
jgi:NADH-quinone oxidoreductase subunit L